MLDLDPAIVTVSDLLAHLEDPRRRICRGVSNIENVIRVAINQEHVEHDASDQGSDRDRALFPPMTGG